MKSNNPSPLAPSWSHLRRLTVAVPLATRQVANGGVCSDADSDSSESELQPERSHRESSTSQLKIHGLLTVHSADRAQHPRAAKRRQNDESKGIEACLLQGQVKMRSVQLVCSLSGSAASISALKSSSDVTRLGDGGVPSCVPSCVLCPVSPPDKTLLILSGADASYMWRWQHAPLVTMFARRHLPLSRA